MHFTLPSADSKAPSPNKIFSHAASMVLLFLGTAGTVLVVQGCGDKEPIKAQFTINGNTGENANLGMMGGQHLHYRTYIGEEIILIDKSVPRERVKGRRWVIPGMQLEQDDTKSIIIRSKDASLLRIQLCLNPQEEDSVCVVKNVLINRRNDLPVDKPPMEPGPTPIRTGEAQVPSAVIKGVRNARLSLDGSTAVLIGVEDGQYGIDYTVNGQSTQATATCINKRMIWPLPLNAEKKNKVAVTRLVRSDDGAKASTKVKAEYGSAPALPPPPPPPLPPSSNEELGSNFGYASHRKPSNISACLNGDKSNKATMRLSASSRCRALQAYLILEAQAKVKVTWQQDGERPHVKSFNLGAGGHQISLSGLDMELLSGRSGTLSIQTEGGALCNGLSCEARKPAAGGVLSIDHQGGEVYLMEVQYKY